MRPDVNRYLKWAFLEAANVICLNHKRFPQRHVHRLYQRVASRQDKRATHEPFEARKLIATSFRDIIMPRADGEDMSPAKPVLDE
jgi:hypothetical protein